MLPATTGNKNISDALIEDQLDRHSRIRAGQHAGERLLFVDRLCSQYVQVFVERGHAAFGKATVAVNQLLQRRLGGQ
jgi:hypothetical protein